MGIWTPPEVRNVKESAHIIRLSYIATTFSNLQFIQILVIPIYIHTHIHICMYNIFPLFPDLKMCHNLHLIVMSFSL